MKRQISLLLIMSLVASLARAETVKFDDFSYGPATP